MPLTDIACKKARAVGSQIKIADGGGMYLLVKPNGSRLWQMAYRFGGKQKVLSFGPYPNVSLQDARTKRESAKAELRDLIDPATKRREERVAVKATAGTTFGAVAAEYLARLADKGSAPATMQKNRHLVERIVNPVLGTRPIAEISSAEVLALLQSLEQRGHHETAVRLRSTMSRVFKLAIVTLRAMSDPTAPLQGAVRAPVVTHHPAITTKREFGRLLTLIDAYEDRPHVAACLKLQALCFARPIETRTMEWAELDLETAKWSIPAEKMKMRRPHEVPLSRQAVAILRSVRDLKQGPRYVFASTRALHTPLSENAMNVALRQLGITKEQHCSHGFRASASTFLNEADFRPEVIEAQLAHVEGNASRRAYNRAIYWPERVALMQTWADMCDAMKGESLQV